MNERLTELKERLTQAMVSPPYDGHGEGIISASAATDCARKLWLFAQGEQESLTAGTDRLPAVRGTILERLMVDYLTQVIPTAVPATRLYAPLAGGNVTGRQDAIITFSDGVSAVVDVKHLGAQQYLALVSGGCFRSQERYYAQLQWYMHQTGIPAAVLLATPFDPSAVRRLLSIARTSRERNIYSYKYLWDYAEDYVQRADPALYLEWIEPNPDYLMQNTERLTGILQAKTPPDRSYNPLHDWQCDGRFCGFRHRCIAIGPCQSLCDHDVCDEERS